MGVGAVGAGWGWPGLVEGSAGRAGPGRELVGWWAHAGTACVNTLAVQVKGKIEGLDRSNEAAKKVKNQVGIGCGVK